MQNIEVIINMFIRSSRDPQKTGKQSPG